MTRSVDVVIVAYACEATIQRCIDSVMDDPVVASIVVVDNASPDRSAAIAATAGATVIAAENRGFGAGCNTGASAGVSPLLLFLNPDAAAGAGTVSGLAAALDQHPGWGAVASELHDPHGRPEPVARRRPSIARAVLEPGIAGRLDAEQYRRRLPHGGEVDWLSAAALMCRRSAFDAIGGFDERYFLYGEDADLCLRLGRAGWAVAWIPGLPTLHDSGGSTAGDADRGKSAWASGWLRLVQTHHGHPRAARLALLVGLRGRAMLWRVAGRSDRAIAWTAAARTAGVTR